MQGLISFHWILLLWISFPPMARAQEPRPLAIRGVTLIDVSHWGGKEHDLESATILVADGKIAAVGADKDVMVPEGYRVIDGSGQFLTPGLIDGFAALNNQSYANAYLYSGVTSILGVQSLRRGPLDLEADPSPRVFRMESLGYQPAATAELLQGLDALDEKGVDVALLMYRIETAQLAALVKRAEELGMATIGELARTTYAEAAAAGVDAFVHTTRYSLDLADGPMRAGVEKQPFSDDLNSAKWRYYKFLASIQEGDPAAEMLGERLAKHGVALMPTGSLGYLDRPGASNPWHEPVARILSPEDIHWPADPKTGRHDYPPEKGEAYAAIAMAELRLDRAYFKQGCVYLAGSGTDVWGTMPGISLHHELEYLVAAGHTPRQVLAAATGNFALALGWRDVGLIEPGRRADLLLLGSDPRTDIGNLKNIRVLILEGRVLDRERLIRETP